MHNRRPLRIASTIGPIETGLLPALEAHEAPGTGATLDRAKQGGIDFVVVGPPDDPAAARCSTAQPT
jgi:ABC-type tungstate transport system permease subunit